MRKSNLFLLYLAINLILLLLMFIHASVRKSADLEAIAEKEEIVRRLRTHGPLHFYRGKLYKASYPRPIYIRRFRTPQCHSNISHPARS